MKNGVAPVHGAHGLAAHYLYANGVNAIGLNVFYVRKMNAIFVAKRQVHEQVFERVDAALGEQLGPLGANAFDHANFGGEGLPGHGGKKVPYLDIDLQIWSLCLRNCRQNTYTFIYTIMAMQGLRARRGGETCACFMPILE